MGIGVVKNPVEAVKWYRKAAEQGNVDAQLNLGICYYRGEGVLRDHVEAYAYYNIAGITTELGRSKLNFLEQEISPIQVEAGQKRSKELQKEIEANIAAKKK